MISLKSKLGYGIGDLANNLMFQLSVLYLLFFYTDVAGIPSEIVAIIFVVARIWDAINDPLMGILIDRTKSKLGKSRVYLRYASLPLAIATIFLFFVPETNQSGQIIYAAITYIIWGMLYTMISIPYSSMTAELSSDPAERTSLSAVRMIFMLVGVIIISVATEPLTTAFDNLRSGYFYTSIIFSVLALVLFQICFYATGKAQQNVDRAAKINARAGYKLSEIFPIVAKNKPLLILTVAFLIGATAEYIREAAIIYFVTYNMGDSSLLPLFMGVVVLSMFLANLLIPMATKRLDKKGTYMVGGIIGILGSVIFHIIPHDSLAAVLSMAAVSSFGFTVVSTLGWAMLPDTVEYGEYKTGVRSEGVIYAFFSFSQKLATALAGGIAALILHLTGYVPQEVNQSPEALGGILSIITIIPIVLIALSMLALKFYSIDKKQFEEIKQSLIRL